MFDRITGEYAVVCVTIKFPIKILQRTSIHYKYAIAYNNQEYGYCELCHIDSNDSSTVSWRTLMVPHDVCISKGKNC